eukprot:scaffold8676_cov139-Skeletonema_marinoi.AAC.5
MPTLIRTLKRITAPAPPNESSKIKSPEVVQLPQNNLTDLVHRDCQLKKNEATSSDPSDHTTSSQKAFTAGDTSDGISAVANSYDSYVRQSDRKQKSSSADSDEELPRKRASNHAKTAPNGCTNWDVNKSATLSSFRGCISEASTDEGLCDRHSAHGNKTADRGEKKRAFPSGDSIDDKKIKKRKRNRHQKPFVIDLSDVPPQQPIPKSKGRTNMASKYAGVTFHKQMNKWYAQIMIEGKPYSIGSYDNEEEAAVDYARAIFKYKGGAHQQSLLDLDDLLKDVPPKTPILKSTGRIKEGSSKYTGVSFHKRSNKWQAQIEIEGKTRRIGFYEDEEEAAVDYARAIFKYKGAHQQSLLDDLKDVPIQSPIPKSASRIKEGASKYAGVTFNKKMNRWQAQIQIEGKTRRIGYYEDEEEAAVDHARAIFKYRGQGALDKARNQS